MSDEINVPEVHELGSQSRKELGQYIDRIETLMEEKSQVSEKIKSEFADAASSGYDKKAIQQIIKERAADTEKSVEHRAIVATYRKALGSLTGTPLGDWARGWMAQEARINRTAETGKSPEMEAFLKKRGAKTDGDTGEARA